MTSDQGFWERDAGVEAVRNVLWSWMSQPDEDRRRDECDRLALALFRWQAQHNEVYGEFVRLMGVEPSAVDAVNDIPFMPVELFKSREVKSTAWPTDHIFRSSGTSATPLRAAHHLDAAGTAWYRKVAALAWSSVWNTNVSEHDWLGLLPGYVGREDASLLAMLQGFCEAAGHTGNRFWMHDHASLSRAFADWSADAARRPLVLFGVTWALLDWVRSAAADRPVWEGEVLVVDTGGMKGRGEEPTREEVLAELRGRLPQARLASEYGMTEMLSQGYAKDGLHHVFPKWVLPVVRDPRDPGRTLLEGRTGRVDVVDLANVHSCAFLATSDAAQWRPEGLKLLGRMDHAEVRGCSLLASE